MYAVVGCGECEHLWIVEGRSKTSRCPRCGSRKPFERRRKFVETEDADHAREVRASMLANRQGHGDAFADLDSFSDLESQVEGGVVDEDEFLEGAGLDPEAIAEAGDRDPRQPRRTGSKKETVERALDELDAPTAEEVVEYAAERGVSRGYVERALEKLTRSGTVSEHDGRYRLL